MPDQKEPVPGRLQPLVVGRVSRIAAGAAILVAIAFVPRDVYGLLGAAALAFLGLSFLVGGLVGNPGCELTALPNLFLRSDKRVHFT